MKNTAEIHSDGLNLYITLISRANPVGKVILTVLNLLVLIFYVYFLTTIQQEEIKQFFIPVILMFVLFIFFPWRYWLWNFYGKEHIILNTKTLTHYKNFRVLQGTPKTMPHIGLGAAYEERRIIDTKSFGSIELYTYSPETQLPELAYQTGILIPKEEADILLAAIAELYKKEKPLTPPFSAN